MEANSINSAMLLALAARLDALSQRLTDPTDKATVAEASNMDGQRSYHSNTFANTRGATMLASDSITKDGVSGLSLPQVIFSFGTAPEYEP